MGDAVNETFLLLDGLRHAAVEGVEVRVTVAVHGTWIAGNLVSSVRYFRAMVEYIKERGTGPGAEPFIEGVTQGLEPAMDQKTDQQPDSVVYLIDTVAISGPTRLIQGPMAIHTRAIDAFAMGGITAEG